MPHPEVSNIFANEPTAAYRSRAADSPLPRCRIAKGSQSGGYDTELASLLQRRLRLVSLLVLIPNVLMICSQIIRGGPDSHDDLRVCFAQTTTAAVVAVLSASLVSALPLLAQAPRH